MRSYTTGLLAGFIALVTMMAPSGAVVITFEDLTTQGPGTGGQVAVTNQYASLGVTFNYPSALDYSKGIPIPGFAHSGTIAIEQCYAAEFCTAPITMNFTAGQARVKAWVGFSGPLSQTVTVEMRGFNAGGTQVTTTSVVLPAKPSGPTPIRYPLEIGRFQADITRVDIGLAPAGQAFNNSLAVDDVEFDTIGPPPPCPASNPPTLTLQSPANGTVTRCNRFFFQDTVSSGDPFARRTVTVHGSAMGQSQAWTTQVASGTGMSIYVYDMLYPGQNTITDRIEDCRGFVERSTTITYDPIPDGVQADVLGFEPTQAVQSFPPSDSLISNKRTVVRVYLSLEGPLASLANVRGRLAAFTAGANKAYELGPPIAPYSVQSLNAVTLTPSTDIQAARRNLNASLNFEIPASWTAAGLVHFELTSLTVGDCDAGLHVQGGENQLPTGVYSYATFEDAPPVRVRIVSVPYRTTSTGPVISPRNTDVDHLRSWLQRAYPTSQVITSRLSLSARTGTPGSTFSADDINSQLQDVRSMETSNGSVDRRTHYYGMVADDAGFMRGKADDIPSWVASGPTGASAFPWDTDGSYGDWYGGHELGHTYGRFHATYCGAQECTQFIWTFCPDGYVPYPYAGGLLDNNFTYGSFGFDVGDPSLGIPMAVYRPDVFHDVMTYCDNEWVSDFTYEGILKRLHEEDPSGDRALKLVRIGDALLLSAKMNLTQETAQLRPFWRLPNLDATDRPTTSHYSIHLRDAANNDLAVYLFAPKVDSEALPGEDVTATLSEIVPWVAGTKRIVIMRDDVELASRTVSANTPTVHVLSPNGGENLDGATATVTWQASDADGQPLTYALHYSKDGGQTWQVVDTGIQATTYTVDLDQIPGSAHALFRVYATDGVNTGSDDSDATFTVRSKPPTVSIISPANGAGFTSADTVVFNGEGSDVEDGPLAGAALAWSSDRQGDLGTGRSISASLVPGQHTITLTATDSSGATATASITITVDAVAPVPHLGTGRVVVTGAPVMLDGSGSTGAPALSYLWEIVSQPDGSTAVLSNPNTATPSFTPDVLGTYILQLTLTDGTGARAVSRLIIVATSVPAALRIAGGLAPSTSGDLDAMNVEKNSPSANVIDILDAARLARHALQGGAGGGIVTVNASNLIGSVIFGRGYGVLIDDPRINDAPDQRVIACHQFIGHYNAALGVQYSTFYHRWVVYNEDHSDLAVGEKINYVFGPAIGAVTRPATGNPFAWGVTLDDPRLNYNPNAIVLAMHDFVGHLGAPLGVFYNGSHWVAYYENGADMPSGERFYWIDAGASGGRVFRSGATAFSSYGVYLDDPRINGNSGAIVLAQHAGVASYNSSPVGVWFDGSRWVAYNETIAPLDNGEAIDYLVVQP